MDAGQLFFLGLEFLAKAIPDPSGEALLFLQGFADKGWIAILVCVLVGTIFTMLINASSATIAIASSSRADRAVADRASFSGERVDMAGPIARASLNAK